MKKPNLNRNLAHPVARRAVAAVLAGLMLVSSVPAAAMAEAADTAQQVVATQAQQQSQDQAATDATATTDAQATTDAATNATTDTTAATPTSDAIAATQVSDQGAAASSSVAALASIGEIDSVEKLDAAADAIEAAAPQNVKLDAGTTTDTGKSQPWSDSNGPTAVDDNITAVKQLFSFAGSVISGNTGDAITALLGFGTKPVEYSNNQLMHSLFDMENQISSLSSQVYQFQSNFNAALAELKLDSALGKIDGFNNYLCKDGEGFKYALALLDQKLPGFCELDENGNPTTTPCSLTTPAQRMPQEARDLVRSAVEYMNNKAKEICNADSAANVEQVLARRICDSDNNVVKAQFDSLDNAYNWDQETFEPKKEFLGWIGQMYMNAYVAESITLNLKLAESDASQADSVRQDLDNLAKRAAAVNDALYGDNGFIKRAEPQAENQVTCYVNGQSYAKGTYAKVSAYKQACFEQAYADGKPNDADKVASNWSVDSTFTADQLCEMIKRFNIMKNAGLAPSLDDSGTKADDVVEEMAAMGFKNVKTTGDEEGTTWAARLAKHKGWEKHVFNNGGKYASLTNRSIELGDPSQQNLIKEESEFHVGERITNSEDWVVTKVKKARVDAGSGWVLSHYKNYACYGEVVNVKTGEKRDDQLLYVLSNYNPESAIGFCDWHYTSTLEYYAFGALRLGTEDATIN